MRGALPASRVSISHRPQAAEKPSRRYSNPTAPYSRNRLRDQLIVNHQIPGRLASRHEWRSYASSSNSALAFCQLAQMADCALERSGSNPRNPRRPAAFRQPDRLPAPLGLLQVPFVRVKHRRRLGEERCFDIALREGVEVRPTIAREIGSDNDSVCVENEFWHDSGLPREA